MHELAAEPRKLWHARTIAYSTLLALGLGLFSLSAAMRESTEGWVERITGPSYVVLPNGEISGQARIAVENGSDAERRFHLFLVESPDASLRSEHLWLLEPRESRHLTIFIDVPRESFVGGKRRVYMRVHDSSGFERIVTLTLRGPTGAGS